MQLEMEPSRHFSIFGLIAFAAIVFAAEQLQQTSWAEEYGAVPSVIVPAFHAFMDGNWSFKMAQSLARLVTAIFLHADAEHIVYNMVFLWTFGYLTSRFLGQWWAVVIFLVCGMCGNILQVWLDAESPIPIIGASGAICGFEGVYLGLALQWRLPDVEIWPLAFPVQPIRLGVFAVLGFLGDIYFLSNHDQHIAFGAHVGGLLSGLLIAALVVTFYSNLGAFERTRQKH